MQVMNKNSKEDVKFFPVQSSGSNLALFVCLFFSFFSLSWPNLHYKAYMNLGFTKNISFPFFTCLICFLFD